MGIRRRKGPGLPEVQPQAQWFFCGDDRWLVQGDLNPGAALLGRKVPEDGETRRVWRGGCVPAEKQVRRDRNLLQA